MVTKPSSMQVRAAANTLGSLVLSELRRRISDGDLGPGVRLSEPTIAREFGTSRGPVREALHTLQNDGWVETRPGDGAFVRNPDVQEVDDFFATKTLLEGEAARLAAANADEEDIKALSSLVSCSAQVIACHDHKRLTELSTQFHVRLGQASGNSVLGEMICALEQRLRFYFALTSGLRNHQAWAEHEELINALRNGDGDAATALIQDHSDLTLMSYRGVVINGDEAHTRRTENRAK